MVHLSPSVPDGWREPPQLFFRPRRGEQISVSAILYIDSTFWMYIAVLLSTISTSGHGLPKTQLSFFQRSLETHLTNLAELTSCSASDAFYSYSYRMGGSVSSCVNVALLLLLSAATENQKC